MPIKYITPTYEPCDCMAFHQLNKAKKHKMSLSEYLVYQARLQQIKILTELIENNEEITWETFNNISSSD